MLYFDLLPSDLISSLSYYLPFAIIDQICDSLSKWVVTCSNNKFWKSYIYHNKPELFSQFKHINEHLNIPFRLLYNAPIKLINDLYVSDTLGYVGSIIYDYLPIFVFYLNRNEKPISRSLLIDHYIDTAIRYRSNNILRYLLENYDSMLSGSDKYTILQIIIRRGDLALVQFLIEHMQYKRLKSIQAIITYAALHTKPEIIRYLLNTIEVSQQTKDIALAYAGRELRAYDNYKLLREYGAK